MSKADTIVAQATPAGRGGISILRLSGPQVREIAHAVLGQLPLPRKACFSPFLDQQGEVLDQGLALFFPAPHSFTSEDVLELQGHGGPVLVHLLLKRLLSLGARLARPGEFSERAFLNGKMDLAQAESIADLIHASSEAAARSALRSLQGVFSEKIQDLLQELIELRAYIEAALDFSEEELDFLSDEKLRHRFEQLLQKQAAIQTAAHQGSLLREGLQVVLAGKPNVGKSTLLNLLSGRELAIVTALPGTTRDVLREPIQLDGLPLHLIDTAGLRDAADPIEEEGIRRAQKEIEQADLLLYVVDAQDPAFFASLPPFLRKDLPLILIRNKIDLTGEAPGLVEKEGIKILSLSAKAKEGVDLLKESIKKAAGFSLNTEGSFSARRRHLEALEKTSAALGTAFHHLQTSRAGELIAEELRLAQKHLGEITGEFSTEDLLGRIFSSFCIGK